MLSTPHLDALAAKGVRFDHAYVQAGVCGPSRMSYYTGRYVSSHGATWNRVPLSVAEYTLGDYLRMAGRSAALAGKTHVMPDDEALARFGIDTESERGALLREGGFVAVDRYDGHLPPGPESGYADYLRRQGYAGADPWNEHVVSMFDGDAIVSGWQMRNVHLPARVRDEHSESAYMSDLAIGWIRAQGEAPWVLHLSYVKPHWPYVAPAPWHACYRGGDTGPILHGPQDGTLDEHPVVHAYRTHDECVSFGQADVARHVRPAYMGLCAQLDHHFGRVLDALEAQGRMRDTLIVFTTDHGEFLGDRGLGEKELFYDGGPARAAVDCLRPCRRAPTARAAPSSRASSRPSTWCRRYSTRWDCRRPRIGSRAARCCRSCAAQCGRLDWRDAVFAELAYGFRSARTVVGRGVSDCHAWMVRTWRWKYVHWQGMRPQLFDLDADPHELRDLGASAGHAEVVTEMRARLFDAFAAAKRRTTVSDEEIERRTDAHRRHGIHIGIW